MTEFTQTRMVRAKSHATKTRSDSRAAACLVAAMFGKGPSFIEEMQRYTKEDMRVALPNRVAVTEGEMLGIIPPSAIRYVTTKGWLRPHGSGGLYFVTEAAASDLKLPRRFKGGQHHGAELGHRVHV